jgi:hypothetical protein
MTPNIRATRGYERMGDVSAETACEIAHKAVGRKRYGCDYCGDGKFGGRSVGGTNEYVLRANACICQIGWRCQRVTLVAQRATQVTDIPGVPRQPG